MNATEYVSDWREKNYERYLFQARVDNTKHRIRKELKQYNPDENKLRKLYRLLEHHQDNLDAWKVERPTYSKLK